MKSFLQKHLESIQGSKLLYELVKTLVYKVVKNGNDGVQCPALLDVLEIVADIHYPRSCSRKV